MLKLHFLCLYFQHRSAAGVVQLFGKIYALGGHNGLSIFDSVEVSEVIVASMSDWPAVSRCMTRRQRAGQRPCPCCPRGAGWGWPLSMARSMPAVDMTGHPSSGLSSALTLSRTSKYILYTVSLSDKGKGSKRKEEKNNQTFCSTWLASAEGLFP